MKKTLFSILFFVLIAVGCSKKTDIKLKIVAPAGAPAISQSFMQHNAQNLGENVSYEVQIVQGKDPLISAFTNRDFDVVVAPIELGAQLYNKNSLDYKLAAVVTFGNLFLATSTEADFTMETLRDRDIVLFGKNSAPDFITQYVIENSGYRSLTHLNSTADTQNHYVANPNTICLIAEPQLTVVKNKVANTKIIDIQSLYKEKSGQDFYPQASIFIKNDLIENNQAVVNKYLEAYQASVEKIFTDVDLIVDICDQLKYGFPKNVLKDSIPRSNIDYKEYATIKDNLDFYFDLINSKNTAILGGKVPDEKFYYQK